MFKKKKSQPQQATVAENGGAAKAKTFTPGEKLPVRSTPSGPTKQDVAAIRVSNRMCGYWTY